jgi:hypothetical protein
MNGAWGGIVVNWSCDLFSLLSTQNNLLMQALGWLCTVCINVTVIQVGTS